MSESPLPACFYLDNCSPDLLKQIKLSYKLINDIGAMDHCPERIGKVYLNRSRCPTSSQSVATNPSLKSCDPPLREKPTLPSRGQPTVKGAPHGVDRTPDLSPLRHFDQSARPLARFRVGANQDIRRLHYLLFSGTPPPSTFDHVKWDCSQMKDADPASYRPESAR